MKRFSKVLAILLAMSLLLCGCGAAAEVEVETEAPEEAVTEAAEEGKEEGEDQEALEDVVEDEPQEEEESKVPEERPLALGKVVDGAYTNEYLDIYFAPEGWKIADADELQDLLEGANEMLEGSELEAMLGEHTQVMDMLAAAPDGITSVNIVYTKMNSADRLAYLAMSEDEMIDVILSESDVLAEAYENAGMEVHSIEKTTILYRGEERIGARTLLSVQGVDLYVLQVFEQTLGSYSVVITATSTSQEGAEEAMATFQKLN